MILSILAFSGTSFRLASLDTLEVHHFAATLGSRSLITSTLPSSTSEACLVMSQLTSHLVGGVLACLKPRGLDQP